MSDKKTILVVDDDPDMLEQVQLILTTAGYEVLTAAGEQQAEEALLSGPIDLAVLDLMMDHMDSGFVLAHAVRRLHPEAPVVVLTGVTASTGISFPDNSGEAREWTKADKILHKPVRAEQLVAEVRRLLKETAPAHAAPGHPAH